MSLLLSIASILLFPCALLLDILLGDPPNAWHPVCAAGSWARRMEAFWKKHLGKTFLSGLLATLCTFIPFLLLVGGSIAATSLFLPGQAGKILSWVIALLSIYFCIAPQGLARHAQAVEQAAKEENLPQARLAVSMIVGRDTQSLDMPGVLRATIESVAENLTDGVLSTLFWAAIGTLLGGAFGCAVAVVLHRVANILDALWGKKNEEYRRFGTFAARTDDALNYLPARLSLPLIALASLFIRKTSTPKAFIMGWKYRYAHPSPNSAWSEATFAGALDLQLSGPISYKGILSPYPLIGEGRREAGINDLRLSIKLMWATSLLTTILCSLLSLLFALEKFL